MISTNCRKAARKVFDCPVGNFWAHIPGGVTGPTGAVVASYMHYWEPFYNNPQSIPQGERALLLLLVAEAVAGEGE